MNALFGDQLYRRDIFLKVLEFEAALSFENLLSHFFQDRYDTWNLHLDSFMVELIKLSCQAKRTTTKNRRTEGVFHLNNRLNDSINLK